MGNILILGRLLRLVLFLTCKNRLTWSYSACVHHRSSPMPEGCVWHMFAHSSILGAVFGGSNQYFQGVGNSCAFKYCEVWYVGQTSSRILHLSQESLSASSALVTTSKRLHWADKITHLLLMKTSASPMQSRMRFVGQTGSGTKVQRQHEYHY